MQEIQQNSPAKKLQAILGTRKLEISLAQKNCEKQFSVLENGNNEHLNILDNISIYDMKIALIGSKGIPASYGGFETFYEQLSSRLAKKGHDVSVYNNSSHTKYKAPFYKGVRLVRFPAIKNKYLDTISHTFLSTIHTIFQGYDIAYYCIAGNSPFTIIPRLFGTKTLLNVDGADWKREKWGSIAKKYIKLSERIALKFPNIVIADSLEIKKRYKRLYNKETTFIPYGSNVLKEKTGDKFLKKYGLKKDSYILFVQRLEPENQAHLLIEAFKRVKTNLKLVIVGDSPYAPEYKEFLRKMAGNDKRIIFTGFVFGEGYRQLSANAHFYVMPSGINGTRPSLLDQMGFGSCILVRNSESNMEVIGDSGLSFDRFDEKDDLKRKLEYLISHLKIVKAFREKAKKRASQIYNWDRITDQYEELFLRLIHKKLRKR